MPRVLIVGWDGATFDLIRPWVAAGKLPNIAQVMNTGTHGELQSTLPPMTFPAWSTFMTGKNPGKHGIYDFMAHRPQAYDLDFVNGGHRKAPTFWQLLSQAGRKVIAVSIPCTFPPEKVNGIMISGFDAPGLGGSGSKIDSRAVYPPEFCTELEQKVGEHPIGSFPITEINQGRPDLAIQKIIGTIRQKAATAKYLLAHHPWDCLMILFGESDGVGHHFWKYCDPKSPLYTTEPAGQQDSIFKVYEELDRQLGEIRALAPDDAVLLMMSDHGFGGVSNWVLYPNCWLREAGFLQFRNAWSQRLARTLDAVKLRAVATLPSRVKRAVYRLSRGRVGGLEARVRFGAIDWTRTQAYFEENPYYPFLWINLKGRQRDGIVAPGAEYEAVRDRLIEALHAWKHPHTGERVVIRAYRREEAYTGPWVAQLPDIIVEWGEYQGYSYAYKLSSKSIDLKWIEEVDPRRQENMQFFTGKSGTHRSNGIFLAAGAGVRAGHTIAGAQIADIAPTILHLMNVSPPPDFDGRVLGDMLSAGFQPGEPDRPPQPPVSSHSDESTTGADIYSDDDEELIAERLRGLGYI